MHGEVASFASSLRVCFFLVSQVFENVFLYPSFASQTLSPLDAQHESFENVGFAFRPSQVAVALPVLGRCSGAASHARDSAEAHLAIDFVFLHILALTAFRA